jgi:glycosyltransferase 2 family protein
MTLNRRMLRLALPLALLALLWHLADGPAVLARLAASDPAWLLAALILTNLQTLLSALRWRLTAARLGLSLPLGHAVGDYYLGALVNQTLPGGVLGDAARALRSRQSGLRIATQAVVIERLTGQIALFAVTLTGLALALAQPGPLPLPAAAARLPLILAAAAGALALALWIVAHVWPHLAQRLTRELWQPFRRSVLARTVWPRQAALGMAIVGCNLLTFDFCARATGTTLPPLALLTLVPLILTAMLVPLSVSGWGLREGAAAGLLPLAGIAPDAALAASVAFGGVILAGSLPGVLFLARRGQADAAVPRPAPTPHQPHHETGKTTNEPTCAAQG